MAETPDLSDEAMARMIIEKALRRIAEEFDRGTVPNWRKIGIEETVQALVFRAVLRELEQRRGDEEKEP